MDMIAEYARATLLLLVISGIACGLIALAVKRGAIGSAIARCRAEFSTNLGLTILNMVLLAPLFAVPEGAIRAAIGSPEALVGFWDAIYAPLTLVLAILLFDFVVYWRHRLEHTPLLWPIHATHHADTAMHWLTVMRKHPISKLLSVCIDIWLLLLLGVPEWAVAGATVIRSCWGFFIHCDVPWTLGPLGKVLISPVAHRLHHIRDERLMGANFGNTLTIWDQVFGTYVDPTAHVNCETGIAEGTRGIIGEILRPFEKRYWMRKDRVQAEQVAESEPAA